MSERQLTILTPEQVWGEWPHISELLRVERYCHGELDTDDLLKLVFGGRAFVVALKEEGRTVGVAVLEVLPFPKRRVLNCIMVGGTGLRYALQDLYGQLVEYARFLGCDALRGFVRPSMSRLLKKVTPKARDIYTVTEIDLCH